MANDTKERILKAALQQFSEKGYEGTNIRELSAALGLSKAAFYKHYESKEKVWRAVIEEMQAYYDKGFGSAQNPPPIPQTAEQLKALTLRMINFTVHDEKVIMTRKLLLTEQFRDETVRALATKYFGTDQEELFERIFVGMMENGALKKGDARMMAFAYAAPISNLVHLCDRQPQQLPQTVEKIGRFIDHFIQVYGRR